MTNAERTLEFLQENHIFYFATVDGDKPKVRPFGFCMVFEGKLYFGMGTHKQSYAQLRENPNVEVCACGQAGSFIRISGKAVFDERPEAQEKMFETTPMLKNMYNEETGRVHALVYLENGVSEFFDMKGSYERLEL